MSRKIEFKTGEYYHLYNRGVDQREIFLDEKDYLRFLKSLKVFNQVQPVESLHLAGKREVIRQAAGSLYSDPAANNPIIDVICYNLLPNHFHLLVKQNIKGGISKFMHKVCSGYAWYFNYKYNRSGSLFQGRFKASQITQNEYLIYLSAYINANSQIHSIQEASKWSWSSYDEYVGKFQYDLIKPRIITDQFKNKGEYAKFVNQLTSQSSKLKMLSKIIFEK